MPANQDLFLDHAEGILHTPSGAAHRLISTAPHPLDPESKTHWIQLPIPSEFYSQHRDEQATVDLKLYFTVFGPSRKYVMPANESEKALGDLGRCGSQSDGSGTLIVFCYAPLSLPPRATIRLVHPITGLRTVRDMRFGELVNYSPFPSDKFQFQPIVYTFSHFSVMHIPGRDLMQKSFTHLLESNVEFDVRNPESQFTASLRVPAILLRDLVH